MSAHSQNGEELLRELNTDPEAGLTSAQVAELLEKHGFVDGEAIGCGQCKYTYLVLPKILTMGKHTESLLRKFVENGGKILLELTGTHMIGIGQLADGWVFFRVGG